MHEISALFCLFNRSAGRSELTAETVDVHERLHFSAEVHIVFCQTIMLTIKAGG